MMQVFITFVWTLGFPLSSNLQVKDTRFRNTVNPFRNENK